MANPVGEESWLAYLAETVRKVVNLEHRVNVIELYKRAVSAEPNSLRLWVDYCSFFWSSLPNSQPSGSDISDEERLMAQELFTFDASLDLWQQGYEAIKNRLHDSHELWNKWMEHEMQLLSETRNPEGVMRVTQLYQNRLVTPHLTWDETSQMFSSFLSEYNQGAWEQSMKDITNKSQRAKQQIEEREPFEMKLRRATRSGDVDSQKSILKEYIDWETNKRSIHSSKNGNIDLCSGLYGRALTSIFSTDEDIWYQYTVYLSWSQHESQALEHLLDTSRRAVQHCPWSGRLWGRYILCAEEAKRPFAEIEAIKHAATSEDELYKGGMESMIEVYVAWCGFLKRTAMDASATDEAVDVADVGLTAALEDVAVVGNRFYDKNFQGDPKFRLERIYIQYLTEKKGALENARAQWNKLSTIGVHADNHEFWLRYYLWEMLVFSSSGFQRNSPTPSSPDRSFKTPTMATAVLSRAASRKTLDWPEKILETYLQHCNDYESPTVVRLAADTVHKAERDVKARREEEQRQATTYAALYAAQAGDQPVAAESLERSEAVSHPDTPGASKRKRNAALEDGRTVETAAKRQRNEVDAGNVQHSDSGPADAKRDRENATIIVRNLPEDVTQTKLRQYFKDYGHINSITALAREDDGKSSTSLIEFRSPEEARSGLLRDGKYFGQSQISVQSGQDLTVYLANFPPSADESYIRKVFEDCGAVLSIRWPSLKVNTHRRFCYISFRDQQASARAIQKDGTILDEKYRLIAKYSDPGHKKRREGAVAEGREVHVTNLDKAVTEAEIRDIFSKLGNVTRVNIPQSLAGTNRGFAFLDFETKDQAEKAAEEMNNVKFRNEIIRVEVSKEFKVKPKAQTTNAARESASPAPSPRDTEGDESMGDPYAQAQMQSTKPKSSDVAARTVALMGLPDTVNDTRVRALVEPVGAIVRLILEPGHGGAKIEFADAASAGKADLKLNGMEFEGRKLRTGSLEELRQAKADRQDDKIQYGSKASKGLKAANDSRASQGLMVPSSVRRPLAKKPQQRRGLGWDPHGQSAPGPKASQDGPVSGDKPKPKSNADFRAMFVSGKKDEGSTGETSRQGDEAKNGG